MKFATYKQLNLLKLERFLKSYPYLSFYHFNNISQAEWKEVKGKVTNLPTVKFFSLKEDCVLKKEKGENCLAEKEREGTTVRKSENSKEKHGADKDSQLWRNENQIRFLVVNSKKILKANSVDLKREQVVSGNWPKRETESSFKVRGSFYGNVNPKGGCGFSDVVFSTEREYKREFVERFFLEGPTLLVGSKSFGSFQNSLRELLKIKKLLLIGGFLEDSQMNPLDLKRVLSLYPVAEKRKIVDTLTGPLYKGVSHLNQPLYNLISVLQLIPNFVKKKLCDERNNCLEKERRKPVEK